MFVEQTRERLQAIGPLARARNLEVIWLDSRFRKVRHAIGAEEKEEILARFVEGGGVGREKDERRAPLFRHAARDRGGDDLVPPLSREAWDLVGMDAPSLAHCIAKATEEFETIDDYL